MKLTKGKIPKLLTKRKQTKTKNLTILSGRTVNLDVLTLNNQHVAEGARASKALVISVRVGCGIQYWTHPVREQCASCSFGCAATVLVWMLVPLWLCLPPLFAPVLRRTTRAAVVTCL